MSLKNTFSKIYKNQIWNGKRKDIPLSGPGSSIENTKHIINFLEEFIYNNNIKSILDIGCGDLTWTQTTKYFNDINIKYTGIDIVEDLIKNHQIKFPNNEFICKDFNNLNINNEYNLIILRDVLFHNTLADIENLFNLLKNKFKFIAITSCNNKINDDNLNNIYRFSKRNLHIKPFNISRNFITKIEEPLFDRCFYIYNYENFYK